MLNPKCKICRRAGEKLFLKGDKCLSSRCTILRKPSPPGRPGKKRFKRGLTEYGKELKEVRKLKNIYGLRENKLKNIVNEVLAKRGKKDVSASLAERLEKLLFNVIFRSGLVKSKNQARQAISHRHFLLNGKRVNIPSIEVKIGDEIKIYEKSREKALFKNLFPYFKPENVPSWLSFDKEKFSIKVVSAPTLKDAGIKVDIPSILSFYSK